MSQREDTPEFRQFMFECLARCVVRMPGIERERFLGRFGKRHGEEFANKLREEMRRQWKAGVRP